MTDFDHRAEHPPEPSGLVRAVQQFDRILFNIESYTGVIAFTIMAIVILAGVIMRFILKIPNMWGEEISRYMMVLGVYMGVACGCRTRSHLAVEGFVAKLPTKASRAVRILTRLTIIGAYGLFMVYAVKMTLTQFNMGQTSPAMQLPMWVVYIGLIAGFSCSCIAEILLFINDFIARKPFLAEYRRGGFE